MFVIDGCFLLVKYKVFGDLVFLVVVWDGCVVVLWRFGEVCELSDRLFVELLKKLVGNGFELVGVGVVVI